MDKKKIIVTGATSFIGSALIRQFINQGEYDIVAIIRPNSCRKKNISQIDSIEIIESELSEIEHVLPSFSGETEAIFHLGWSSDFDNPRYNISGQLRNIEYLHNVIELANTINCKKVIGIGSQAECGRVYIPITESTINHPETAYAIAKCKAYEEGIRQCREYGMNFYWPRLLSAYGPNDKWKTFIMSCMSAAKYGTEIMMTKCEQIWDYIYVDDVARALIAVLKRGEPEVKYTLSSGNGMKLIYYVSRIAEIMNAPWILDGIGKREYSEDQVMYLVGDITRLVKDTGFSVKMEFDEGIKQILLENYEECTYAD